MNRKKRNFEKMDYRKCRSIIGAVFEGERIRRFDADPVNRNRKAARLRRLASMRPMQMVSKMQGDGQRLCSMDIWYNKNPKRLEKKRTMQNKLTSDRGEKAITILKYLLAYGGWYMGAIEGDRMRQDFEMLQEKALSLMTDEEKAEIEKYYGSTEKWKEIDARVKDI